MGICLYFNTSESRLLNKLSIYEYFKVYIEFYYLNKYKTINNMIIVFKPLKHIINSLFTCSKTVTSEIVIY